MANNKDTIKGTLIIVIVLSFVCSIIVSTAAVVLKPNQVLNAKLDVQKNLVAVAGFNAETPQQVQDIFAKNIEPRLLDLKTGDLVAGDAESYDMRAAAKDTKQSIKLTPEQDIVKIQRLPNKALIYLVKKDGKYTQVLVPVNGSGLWSMMYAFVAIDIDGNTVNGITFYEQGETAGLGGEVENPKWRAQFEGKTLYDENHQPAIHIYKGGTPNTETGEAHGVDGLSGATLTSNGVQHIFDFWFNEEGYGQFLAKLKAGEVQL